MAGVYIIRLTIFEELERQLLHRPSLLSSPPLSTYGAPQFFHLLAKTRGDGAEVQATQRGGKSNRYYYRDAFINIHIDGWGIT